MKRIIINILIFACLPLMVAAQEEAGETTRIWSHPVVYNYDEPVSWFFDLGDTTFEEDEEVYMWIWEPSEPDAGNWENSSEFAKLTHVGNKIWRFDLVPTEYFGVGIEAFDPIEGFPGFWHRLKNHDGTKQGGVTTVPVTLWQDFLTAGTMITSFPERPSFNEPVSILFNTNHAAGFEGAENIFMHGGLNDWDVVQGYHAWMPAAVEKTRLKNLGNGIFKMDLIPSEYFGSIVTEDAEYKVADAEYEMENMTFLLVRDEWAATTPDQILHAAAAVIPPDPILSFYPLRISQKDILGIWRKNNERGVNTLNYKITAGEKEIEGQFSGDTQIIKGFVNLADELKGISNLSQIRIVLTDNNDREVIDTNIPLVTLD